MNGKIQYSQEHHGRKVLLWNPKWRNSQLFALFCSRFSLTPWLWLSGFEPENYVEDFSDISLLLLCVVFNGPFNMIKFFSCTVQDQPKRLTIMELFLPVRAAKAVLSPTNMRILLPERKFLHLTGERASHYDH